MSGATSRSSLELYDVPRARLMRDRVARGVMLAASLTTLVILVALLALVIREGAPALSWNFLTNYPSRFADRAGIWPAIIGTIWIGAMSVVVAVPVGVMAAVYLNEFAPDNAITGLLRASIANLAGVPSVVFGILGLALFSRLLGLGPSILAAGLTLGLLTLPITVVASEEALKAVPSSMREAALALGASKWQTVRHHVLPYAVPGMLTGSILALSRAVGETAPLIVIGAALYLAFLPQGILDSFMALPITAFNWAAEARTEFHALAWGAVLVLIAITVMGNLTAILLRNWFERKYRW